MAKLCFAAGGNCIEWLVLHISIPYCDSSLVVEIVVRVEVAMCESEVAYGT